MELKFKLEVEGKSDCERMRLKAMIDDDGDLSIAIVGNYGWETLIYLSAKDRKLHLTKMCNKKTLKFDNDGFIEIERDE